MSTLHAFGASFVYGMIENENNPPYGDVEHDRPYTRPFPIIVAEHFDLKPVIRALPGRSNNVQLTDLYTELINDKILSTDLIFYGITEPRRDPSVRYYKGQDSSWEYVHNMAYCTTRLLLEQYSRIFDREILIADIFKRNKEYITDKWVTYRNKNVIKEPFDEIAVPGTELTQRFGHPNEEGHKAIAEQVIKAVYQFGLHTRFERYIYD